MSSSHKDDVVALPEVHPSWAVHRLTLALEEAGCSGNEEIPTFHSIHPLFDDDDLKGYSTIARNNSQSQRREQELRESGFRFRRAVLESPHREDADTALQGWTELLVRDFQATVCAKTGAAMRRSSPST